MNTSSSNMTALIAAAFLLLQPLCQVLATVIECDGELPIGYVKYPADNTAIKFYAEKLTWYDARERCIAEGADLAVVTTSEKVRHIENLISGSDMWIGIHRLSGIIGGDWVRVDTGLPVTSSLPWKYFTNTTNYNCVLACCIGSITNWRCTEKYPFACEISLAEGPGGLAGAKGGPGIHGAPGPMGPPGPPGPGYNATWLALLAVCQEQGRVMSSINCSQSPTDFGNYCLVKQKCEGFIAQAYAQISIFFQNLFEREVQKEATAKTCRDLFVSHPDTPSGEYWIDPNGDDASDKILVYCDVEKRSTCITPAVNQSQIITYEGKKQQVWLSEHEMGMQITYAADDHQINALQSLSRHAEQKVTYHCIKSIGYFDAAGQTYDRGLKLSAWNGVQLKPRGRLQFRYDVISDECQNRISDWRNTTIAFRTNKPVLLPVVDVALRDLGTPEKRAIIEIGEVCFS